MSEYLNGPQEKSSTVSNKKVPSVSKKLLPPGILHEMADPIHYTIDLQLGTSLQNGMS